MTHPKPAHKPTPLDQILGDTRAAIKAIGKHGTVVLVVVAPDEDGTILHHVERSSMTTADWDRLMREAPRRVQAGHLKKADVLGRKNEGRGL